MVSGTKKRPKSSIAAGRWIWLGGEPPLPLKRVADEDGVITLWASG